MKTSKTSTIVLFIALALFISCSGNTGKSDTAAGNTIEKVAKKGKYGIKSGIIVYATQMMGMDVEQTLTFDDYGSKEVQDVEMEMMGFKVHSLMLNKDGYNYNIDMIQKTGTKTPAASLNPSEIDFENITEEMTEKMNLKKVGSEEFLGKKCDIMTIDYKEMDMTGTYLLYKGIPLKIETSVSGLQIKLEALEFTENPDLPAGRFDIPEGISIEE